MKEKMIITLLALSIKFLHASDMQFPSFLFFSQAFDTEKEPQNFQYKQISDSELPIIMGNISHLLEIGAEPKKIVCILDVDGTLTDESDPTFAGETTYPRSGTMINFVRSLHSLGITMIASSAWDVFAHTKNRIKRLGLIDVFITPDAAFSTKPMEIRDKTFLVESFGNIISVKNSQSTSNFYRAKLISTLVTKMDHPSDSEFPYSHIFFFDDSERNISLFRSDFRWLFEAKEAPHTFAYLLEAPVPNAAARNSATFNRVA